MAVKKVWIEEGCTVCGVCADLAPEVFQLGDDSSTVIAGANLAANSDAIIDAARNCPVEIIKYEE
ncbi:MAG TPA: ferredoxin [bacterium]